MSKYQKITVLNVVAIIATIAFGLSLKNSLPALIPTKFDASGVALTYAPFMMSVFFLPLVASIAVFLLTWLVKKNATFWANDCNREAVAQTNLGIIALIASMYVGTFLNALNYAQYSKFSAFAIGFGLFFVISASAMKKIEKNLLYGIRLPWTLKSDLNWKKTHELTAVLMLVAGGLLIITGLFTRNHTIILSLITLTFLVPSVYSFKIRKLA